MVDDAEPPGPGSGDDDVDRGPPAGHVVEVYDPALQVFVMPCGTLRQYYNDKKQDIYLVAKCDKHKDCFKQRTMLGRKGVHGNLAQGRCVGFLCAWLEHGRHVGCASKHDHMKSFDVTLEERKAGREAFKLVANAAELLKDERNKRDGEESEPEGQP